jgi:hypothetical protein
MNSEKKRKSPVPANSDRITEGALKLPLEKRVILRNDISASIERELKEMESNFEKAKALLNGKQ